MTSRSNFWELNSPRDFVKHHLDPCLAANVRTHFMDIAAGVENSDEIMPALRKVFDCLRQSGMKLSTHKCELGTTKIDYLGSTITPRVISPTSATIDKLVEQIRLPNTVKKVKRLRFVLFFRYFIPKLGQKLLPFCRILRKENAFTITTDHRES